MFVRRVQNLRRYPLSHNGLRLNTFLSRYRDFWKAYGNQLWSIFLDYLLHVPDSRMLQSQQVFANAPRKLNTVTFSDACGSNNLESLSGIETIPLEAIAALMDVPITLNPYQGMKHLPELRDNPDYYVPITLNPYQGLKRAWGWEPGSKVRSRSNNLESLSGIETGFNHAANFKASVPITLNPYQGLKLIKGSEVG